MSTAEDRRVARHFLAGYSLMSPADLAQFLGVGESTAMRLLDTGRIPSIRRGAGTKRGRVGVDPLDAAVYALAERDGLTIEEYWREHGEDVPERARQYVERRRRFAG